MTGSYDDMMGSPMDVKNHPANTVPNATQHYAGDLLEPKPSFSDLTPKQKSGLRGVLDEAESEYAHQEMADDYYNSDRYKGK